MEIYKCKSSMVKSATYDKESKLLHIQFNDNAIYSYQNFPLRLWKRLKISKSVGKFVNKYIKPKYEGKLIKDE